MPFRLGFQVTSLVPMSSRTSSAGLQAAASSLEQRQVGAANASSCYAAVSIHMQGSGVKVPPPQCLPLYYDLLSGCLQDLKNPWG